MKTKSLFAGLILVCSVFAWFLHASPRPVSETPPALKKESVVKKGNPVLIKNLITRIKNGLDKDTDVFPRLIRETEQSAASMKNDVPSVSVLQSMVAQLYYRYYMNNRWQIDGRTPLIGYVPEDMQVWSANIFEDSIRTYINRSLEHASVLQQTPVSLFNEILTEGEDSPELRPTVYDFLAYRGISMLNELSWNNDLVLVSGVEQIYNQLISFRKKAGDPKALLMAELDYIRYLYTRSGMGSQENADRYLASLDSLQKQYADNDFSVEIMNERASVYQNLSYQQPGNADSLKALAYTICLKGIERFPDYSRIGILKNRLDEMVAPLIRTSYKQEVYPGRKLKMNVHFRNINRVTVSVYESRLPVEADPDRVSQEKKQGKQVARMTFSFEQTAPYVEQDTVLYIPFDELGYYECGVTTDKATEEIRKMVSVTRLLAGTRSGIDDNILVTDSESGKPQEGARVLLFKRPDKSPGGRVLAGEVKSDKDGLVSTGRGISEYRVVLGKDTALPVSYVNTYIPSENQQNKSSDRMSLFTDRGIYRPGQTVFFKGIAYNQEKGNARPLVSRDFTLTLYGSNGKTIVERVFKTNEFGSFNGSFTLPRQTLGGLFSIRSENGYVSFRVEEYKRPSFSVEFLPVTQEVVFGQTLPLEGTVRTFSGVNVQDATVHYTIVRIPFWFRSIGSPFSTETVAEGTVPVTEDGMFKISFLPERGKTDRNDFNRFYNYKVTATVTSSSGETEQGNLSFIVGNRSLILSADASDKINKDNASLTIFAKNQNNQPVAAKGTFSLFRIKSGTKMEDPGPLSGLPIEKKEYEGGFTSNEPLDVAFMKNLPSGRYLLCMQSVDSGKRLVADSVSFVLYGTKDKRPPVYTDIWLLPVITECIPGEHAEFVFGTSVKDAYVLYQVLHENKALETKRFVLDNENRICKLPFKQEYGDGVSVILTFVKKGKMYSGKVDIKKKQPSHKLLIQTQTFRDRLLPGQKETWRFRVTNPDSLPVLAEVLASMYDASLDKLLESDGLNNSGWWFDPFSWNRYRYNNIFQQSNAFGVQYGYAIRMPKDFAEVPPFRFDELNWQNAWNDIGRRNAAVFARTEKLSANAPVLEEAVVVGMGTQRKVSVVGAIRSVDTAADKVSTGAGQAGPAVRSNFSETAFFYPSLMTNREGDIILSFEVPQSNTTWKLRMLATTQELAFGELVKEAISQKRLMVQPNLPRFMRWGDQVTISTVVMNMSGKDMSGKVRLELFNPETEEPVVCLTKSERPFTLSAGSMTTVSWSLSVPDGINLLGCRIVAETPDASDGEQHLVPVLPNELQVTESTSFTISGSGTATVKTGWSPLSSSARPVRMTLEYADNPAWYAVQALPSLTMPDNDNVVSWFAAYYGNVLASHIARNNPRIRSMVDQWEKSGKGAGTFYSDLEKNQELKNILLQETPWVLAAQNEAEQKCRLALLFDPNLADNNRSEALRKLQELQLADGAWPWCKGMYPNAVITLYVMEGMARLTHLGAVEYTQEEKKMQIKALQFIDKCMQKDYELIQKSKSFSLDKPSVLQLECLVTRSLFRDIPEAGDARDAYRYFTTLAETGWQQQSLYGKALTAQLLYRNGKKEAAIGIIDSLRKLATRSKEMGMYWANNRETLLYFISPVSIHCRLMDACNEISPDVQEADQMKLWLLKQKQTQYWPSVPATLNAVYALLNTGSDWLADQGSSVIRWGKHTYDSSMGEDGTGYIQELVEGDAIVTGMETLAVEKTGKAPAFGAVYRQYFEKMDWVKASRNGLSVEKKLFVEKSSLSGAELYPVTEKDELKVGDKVVVRLIVQADRTMDYVYLKDLRAGCFEPVSQLSKTEYRDGIVFYRSPGDVAENFFFDRLPKGTFVLEYAAYVSRPGQYAGGITTLQCLYAPEFVSHTSGETVVVKE